MNDFDLAPNAVRGAELLDSRLPGWRSSVNEETLDLSNDCGCVLGHIFGSYEKGVKVLDLTHAEALRYGFWKRGRQSWERLSASWRTLVRTGSSS